MALPLYGYNPYQFGQVNPLQPQMDRLASMQAQYQQPQQPNVNQGILWVQGEAGAKSYLVAPNTSVLLMDSENSQFFIKTTDNAGMPTLRTFEYREVTAGATPEAQQQPETNLDDKYVTRQEYDDLRVKYEELYGMFEKAKTPTTTKKPARKDE